jgi:hypothetical protein
MLDLLSNNIIKYVLNRYLSFHLDIIKLKQLYNFKFNLKQHKLIIFTSSESLNFNKRKYWSPNEYYLRKFYIDQLLTYEKLYYINKNYEIIKICSHIHIYYKHCKCDCNKCNYTYYTKNQLHIKHIIVREYYKNGNLKLIGIKSFGVWVGLIIRYTRKGQIQYKKYYYNDERIKEREIQEYGFEESSENKKMKKCYD